mgnify:CR=1 FL=1
MQNIIYRYSLILLICGFVTSLTPGCALDAITAIAEDRHINQVTTDAEIKLDINKRLIGRKGGDLFFDINTDIYEGRVMLTGSVPSGVKQTSITALVKGIPGIREVYNDVQVKGKNDLIKTANDVWIATKIRALFLAERGIRSINLRWRVVNSEVYLIGQVRSDLELRKVITIAKNINDVKRVIHHIVIKNVSKG